MHDRKHDVLGRSLALAAAYVALQPWFCFVSFGRENRWNGTVSVADRGGVRFAGPASCRRENGSRKNNSSIRRVGTCRAWGQRFNGPAGARNFYRAGADFAWMQRMAEYSFDENLRDALGLAYWMRTLDRLPKPTIAIVDDATYSGDVELVACCDIAIASQAASLYLSEVTMSFTCWKVWV